MGLQVGSEKSKKLLHRSINIFLNNIDIVILNSDFRAKQKLEINYCLMLKFFFSMSNSLEFSLITPNPASNFFNDQKILFLCNSVWCERVINKAHYDGYKTVIFRFSIFLNIFLEHVLQKQISIGALRQINYYWRATKRYIIYSDVPGFRRAPTLCLFARQCPKIDRQICFFNTVDLHEKRKTKNFFNFVK